MRRRDFLRVGIGVGAAAGTARWSASPLASAANVTRQSGAAATIEDAFFYAFPLYEFARTEQERTGAVDGKSGALNRLAHRSALADHTSRQVTAPNNDTIYSSCFMDLAAGPVDVAAPSSPERYYSVAFMDAFTDNFAYIGTRATKGKGGRFWGAGPQWSGRVPDGVTLIRSTTNDNWMLMRTLVEGDADLPAARAFQTQLTVTVPPGTAAARPFTTKAADVSDPRTFLAVVNEMLSRSPGGKGQTARAARFAAYGIGAATVPPDSVDRWTPIIAKGLATLRTGFLFRDQVVDGWSYQPRGVGDFGDNDRLRATVALGGLAALGEEEAMYFHANFDATGERLSGQHAYRWQVPAGGVPADAFWSLTMYEVMADGRFFLVDNPIRRYAIGDRTPGLSVNADGSFDIVIQRHRPDGALASNWLPSPEGPLRLALRAYLPKPALLSRQWRVPPLRRIA
jgi:hypothetical protein